MIAIDLTGKTALVTGASQGLGAATAAMLHKAGANVVVNYLPDERGANRSNAERVVAQLGERTIALPADVRDPPALSALVDATLARFGSLDIVVNNAAVLRDRTLKKMTQAEWQDVIDTNLTGVFNVCKAAVERIADGGRIVNMASVSAMIGVFGQSNYVAAKAGVIGLTKVLSRELAKRRVTVNAVAPGVVLTEMGRSIPDEQRRQMLAQIPLGRYAEADDVAGAVLFLCSELAAYMTGQTVHVNGGWYG